jgi:hypothetical protein
MIPYIKIVTKCNKKKHPSGFNKDILLVFYIISHVIIGIYYFIKQLSYIIYKIE